VTLLKSTFTKHPLVSFSPRLTFFILALFRALLHHVPHPKARLLTDPDLPGYLVSLISSTPAAGEEEEKLESTVYSLMTALLRDEPEHKRALGP
jgi:hypothetical protein